MIDIETAERILRLEGALVKATAEVERMREALERISRMKTAPDNVMNLVTLSAAIKIANDAINPEPAHD